uniref:Cytochrome P450 VoCYP71DJ1 n=1 Tax=Valeriana officinalis TaxID=19953 RepID=A0A2R4NA61_VALOF|nr:cytochrome P450 VoCYP71DJ1 [Valeriana officinalis]
MIMEDLNFSIIHPILLIFVAFVIIENVRKNKKAVRRPPGPWQFPLIGNMHNLFGSSPHRVLRDLSNKYGPIMLLRLGTVPTLVVSSAELAEEILKIRGVEFADRPHILAADIVIYNSTDILFSPYGDHWRQMRKVCAMELLSTRKVQSFRSIREEEVLNLLQLISSSCASGSALNLTKLLFSFTYTVITRVTFGEKWTEQPEKFSSLLSELVVLFSGFNIADMYPSVKFIQGAGGFRARAEKVHQRMDETFTNIIMKQREKNKATSTGESNQEHLINVLLRVQKHAAGTENPFTDDSIKGVLLDIFNGGSETSSTTMEWAMAELIKNPRAMERAQTELRQAFSGKGNVEETGLDKLKYFHCIIKETMRLHPPFPLMVPRQNRHECEINGYIIPAKTKVLVNGWAISRNPKYWGPDADVFKPERFLDNRTTHDYKGTNSEYIPFGAGKRICPGTTFALAAVELPLAQLLYHFDWNLATGLQNKELEMTEQFGIVVRKKCNLHLNPLPYSGSFLDN